MTRFHRHSSSLFMTVLIGVLAVTADSASAQPGANADTIRAGRFDGGKMWTFEYAPGAYFSETYGFDANGAWFERARMAAVRIPGCSASFVSPNGLLATNHHCVRSRVSQVSREGEGLLDNGLKFRPLTLPNFFIDHDKPAVQIEKAGLDAPAIAAAVLSAFGIEDETLDTPARA